MRESFGVLPDGRAAHRFALRAGSIEVRLLDYGARIASVSIDLAGGSRHVVLGFPDLAGYVADRSYQGAMVGRFANRIEGGRFPLVGDIVRTAANDGMHTLHGGPAGFDRALWAAEADNDGVVFRHVSPDGDQGFSGRLDIEVRYALDSDGSLSIVTRAATNAPTVINIANHAYFNLAGSGSIDDHVLTIHAARFLPIDRTLIPTGELRDVTGTPMDFRQSQRIGDHVDTDDLQIRLAGGYDHCFILDGVETLRPAARLQAADIVLDVLTTEPGVQFYSGNFLNGAPAPRRGGLCLETQHYPDSPNRPHFPTTALHPGEIFESRTVYRFSPA